MKTLSCIFLFICLNIPVSAEEYTYYYYPKYEAYYRVETKTWFYHNGCSWAASKNAPKEMPFFMIKKNHRVLLSYKGPNPLVYHIVFKKKYPEEGKHRGLGVRIKSSWKSSDKKNSAKVTVYSHGRTINN
jgi:hypothetical protein